MKPITLVSERLILRRANKNDCKNLFRNYLSDKECSRFLTRKPHFCVDQTKKFLAEWCDIPWDIEQMKFAWVIAMAKTNQGIGVFLVNLIDAKTAQIHYGISQAFFRKGLIAEAGHKVMMWMRTQGITHIFTVCDLENYGSIKVLEKLGFQKKNILKKHLILPAYGNEPRDCYLYSYNFT